jgi:D-glycero-alpha-D-manno-heptose 1-phosphate guanylyltransferase
MSSWQFPERALILAGGLGTRLASLLPDRPKVLAPIAGRAFLDILVEQLAARGLRRFVLLLGSRSEQVVAHVEARRGQWPAGVEFELSVEPEPLGTGGALKHAARYCEARFFLLNGDTYFDLDLPALVHAHERAGALVSIAAATVAEAGRYGRLEVSSDGLIERFREKESAAGPGLINAGIYLVEPAVLGSVPSGHVVSLEREVFPALLAAGQRIGVSPQTGAFFDIGTPPSYASFVEFCQGAGSPQIGGMS